MEYLPAKRYSLWKERLRRGAVDPDFAVSIGDTLGRIHAATAAEPSLVVSFPSDAIFYDVRLEPYLTHAGRAHPDLEWMELLIKATQSHKHALMQGDICQSALRKFSR